MRFGKEMWMFVAVVVFAMTAVAQEQKTPEIKHVPVQTTSPASAKEMYTTYCAVCHGQDGKGNGPAATALKTPPTDLTTLAKNNGGRFPAMKVSAVLRGEEALPAHGSREMPIWGRLFWNMSNGHEGEVQQRIANLNKYIESMQQK